MDCVNVGLSILSTKLFSFSRFQCTSEIMPLSTTSTTFNETKGCSDIRFSKSSQYCINKCIYTSANPFGVKLYNTAPDTSNFTVTIHTQNLDCSDPHIHVYGDQTKTQNHISNTENLNHFIGNFRELNYQESKSETHKCVYQTIVGGYWPYVFVKITQFSAENSFVCEVQFKDSQ